MMKFHVEITNENVNRLEVEEIILAALEAEGYNVKIYDLENEKQNFHLCFNEFPNQLKEIMLAEDYKKEDIDKATSMSTDIYRTVMEEASEDVLETLKQVIKETIEK